MGAVSVGSASIVTVLMFLVIVAAGTWSKGAAIETETGYRFLLFVAVVAVLILLRPVVGLAFRVGRRASRCPATCSRCCSWGRWPPAGPPTACSASRWSAASCSG